MAETEIQRLDRRYGEYDEVVEIVSAAEVWFTESSIASTVRHFERYPTVAHPDGNPATPDFTVLFNDDTAIVGEIARLSLEGGSFESLWRQLDRYATLTEIPAGGGTFVSVDSVDVIAFILQDAANRVCDLIDVKRQGGGPPHISVFSFGRRLDGGYDFNRLSRANNPRPRGHERDPSLEAWLADEKNADTLSGRPDRWGIIKARARFCNDPMSELYLATVLWSQVIAEMAGGKRDLKATPEEIASELRTRFGCGKVTEVLGALRLLKAARLAAEAEDHWVIPFQPLGSPRENVKDVLLRRLESPPRGPVTHAAREERRKERRETRANRAAQDHLEGLE